RCLCSPWPHEYSLPTGAILAAAQGPGSSSRMFEPLYVVFRSLPPPASKPRPSPDARPIHNNALLSLPLPPPVKIRADRSATTMQTLPLVLPVSGCDTIWYL